MRAAKQAGWRVLIKEAMANGRLVREPPALLAAEATRLGATCDAIALAVARAQPFADVVLSGAATVEQVRSNAVAIDVDVGRLGSLVVPADVYWAARAKLAWT